MSKPAGLLIAIALALATGCSTSPATSDPVTDPAGTGGKVVGLTWRGPWSPIGEYRASDVVAFAGSSFVALVANNATVPETEDGTVSPSWHPLAVRGKDGVSGAGLRPRGQWLPDVSYLPGDIVVRNGSSFAALRASIAALPPDPGDVSDDWMTIAAAPEPPKLPPTREQHIVEVATGVDLGRHDGDGFVEAIENGVEVQIGMMEVRPIYYTGPNCTGDAVMALSGHRADLASSRWISPSGKVYRATAFKAAENPIDYRYPSSERKPGAGCENVAVFGGGYPVEETGATSKIYPPGALAIRTVEIP